MLLPLLLACERPPSGSPTDEADSGALPDPWGAAVAMSVSADGQPTVAGTIDGDSVVWALDTGSDGLYVDEARLERNVGHVDATVGSVDLGSVSARALDLAEADAAAGIALGGLAGQTLFADRAVAFSYATGEAWFPASLADSAPAPCSGASASAPYALASGVPVSPVTFTVTLVRDGASRDVALPVEALLPG
jgi:hypothetical protein